MRRSLLCPSPGPLPSRLSKWNLSPVTEALEGEECAICLAPLLERCVRTRCGHHFHVACLEQSYLVSASAVCPLCRGSLRGPLDVTARSASGRRIEVMEAVPGIGSKCHTDRNYRFVLLGDFSGKPGMMYLMTSNNDKMTPWSNVMWTLETKRPATVHLNFRSEAHVATTGISNWLQEAGWQRSGLRSTVSTGVPNGLYWGPVYSKEFDAGTIELMGSNCPLGTYFVFVEVQQEN